MLVEETRLGEYGNSPYLFNFAVYLKLFFKKFIFKNTQNDMWLNSHALLMKIKYYSHSGK